MDVLRLEVGGLSRAMAVNSYTTLAGHLNAIFVLRDEIYRNASKLLQLGALKTFNAPI